MKRIILASFIAITSAITTTSCNKTNETDIVPGVNTQANKDGSMYKLTKCPHGPCHSPANNCVGIKEVVIHTPRKAELLAVATSGNSGIVGDFFSEADNADLVNALENEYRDKLQSGEYFVTLNFDSENVVNFYVGTTFPVTDDNSEFVLEYTK